MSVFLSNALEGKLHPLRPPDAGAILHAQGRSGTRQTP
jgi:hypothetical protein